MCCWQINGRRSVTPVTPRENLNNFQLILIATTPAVRYGPLVSITDDWLSLIRHMDFRSELVNLLAISTAFALFNGALPIRQRDSSTRAHKLFDDEKKKDSELSKSQFDWVNLFLFFQQLYELRRDERRSRRLFVSPVDDFHLCVSALKAANLEPGDAKKKVNRSLSLFSIAREATSTLIVFRRSKRCWPKGFFSFFLFFRRLYIYIKLYGKRLLIQRNRKRS